MEKQIPLAYRIILKRLWAKSEFGRLGLHQAKVVLSHDCRVGKENIFEVLKDLESREYVQIITCKAVVIKIPIKDLV